MRIVILHLLVFLAVSPAILSANGEYVQPEYALSTFLSDGQEYFYSGNYEMAVEFFDKHVERYPDDPVGYWRRINAEYLIVRARNEKDEPRLDDRVAYAKLMVFLDTGIEKAEIKIRDGKKADFYRFIGAALFGMKGIFEYANGFKLSSRDSSERMREFVTSSKYRDALYLVGFLEYKISQRNFLERFFLSKAFGLPTNRKNGLRLIADALNGNNNPFVYDIKLVALNILCGIDKNKELEEAENYLRVSRKGLLNEIGFRYPQNPLILECGVAIDG